MKVTEKKKKDNKEENGKKKNIERARGENYIKKKT